MSKKAVFEVWCLSEQVATGSIGALVKAARTNSRHHTDVIMRGVPLECSRPSTHLLSVGSILSGHISLDGIYSPGFRLGL